jgi:uncharacterized membrane protein
MTATEAAAGRVLGVSTMVVVVAVLAYYLFLISSQSTRDLGRVGLVVALSLAVLACIAGGLLLDSPAGRGIAGAGAAGMLLSMSVLALFSIGLLLLVGAIMSVAWLVRTRSERRGVSSAPVVAAFCVGALLPWMILLA